MYFASASPYGVVYLGVNSAGVDSWLWQGDRLFVTRIK